MSIKVLVKVTMHFGGNKVPLRRLGIVEKGESVTIREMRKGWESEADNGECLSGRRRGCYPLCTDDRADTGNR